jgi:hypothetical protein
MSVGEKVKARVASFQRLKKIGRKNAGGGESKNCIKMKMNRKHFFLLPNSSFKFE